MVVDEAGRSGGRGRSNHGGNRNNRGRGGNRWNNGYGYGGGWGYGAGGVLLGTEVGLLAGETAESANANNADYYADKARDTEVENRKLEKRLDTLESQERKRKRGEEYNGDSKPKKKKKSRQRYNNN